jgi:hypothetical protein
MLPQRKRQSKENTSFLDAKLTKIIRSVPKNMEKR